MWINSTGFTHSGDALEGDIEILAKPSQDYELKPNWPSVAPDVWQFSAAKARARVAADVSANTTAKLAVIIEYYPKYESDTWPSKLAQASAWKAMSNAEKQAALSDAAYRMIFVESTGKVTPAVDDIPDIDGLCQAILYNKAAFETYSGLVLKRKTDLMRQLAAAELESEFAAIAANVNFDDIQYGV